MATVDYGIAERHFRPTLYSKVFWARSTGIPRRWRPQTVCEDLETGVLGITTWRHSDGLNSSLFDNWNTAMPCICPIAQLQSLCPCTFSARRDLLGDGESVLMWITIMSSCVSGRGLQTFWSPLELRCAVILYYSPDYSTSSIFLHWFCCSLKHFTSRFKCRNLFPSFLGKENESEQCLTSRKVGSGVS